MPPSNISPKYLQEIELFVKDKLKNIKRPSSELHETQQVYLDRKVEIYREAFQSLISKSVTYSKLLNAVKVSYEDAIHVRDERIRQFIIQDIGRGARFCIMLPVTVLDGGFSTQLSCHVGDKVDGDPLWTARFLKSNPEDVMQTHLDFLRAGADAIMTNTYQASIGGFVKHLGLTYDEAYQLIKHAVELARKARDIFLKENLNAKHPLIVGSVGPYGAHFNDGSEYSGSYANVTSKETIINWHRPRIQALIEAGVDILALETIPCEKEGQALNELLKEFPGTKAWMSFNCKDDKTLAHGEEFSKVAVNIWESNQEQLIAVGANCLPPLYVANLFKPINENRETMIPLVVYPNSGEKYSASKGWQDKESCKLLDTYVSEWLDLGVRFVGGCCRTYVADITKIRKAVDNWCIINKL